VNRIQILPLGSIAPEILSGLATGLSSEFRQPCEFLPEEPDPAFAYNLTRQQYSSTEILAALVQRVTECTGRLLAVAPVDLYIPILTFVFGEAQLNGLCAIVSYHRLRQEFYGLPADNKLLHRRLLKEAVHELGHTHSIQHCEDYQCVMSPSHSVEWIDLKTSNFCTACRAGITTPVLRIVADL
jgi:archaemetzincin